MKLWKLTALCTVGLALPYLAAYGLCWLVLLLDNVYLIALLYLVGASTPVLFALSGYFAPVSVRKTPLPQLVLILAVLALLPAAVIWWGESAGNELVWMLDMPQRMTALTYFAPIFHSPQSAFVLNVIQPFCVAASSLLMTAGYALGLFVRSQKE